MIGRNGERRSGISAQAARHDDVLKISYPFSKQIQLVIIHSFLKKLFESKFLGRGEIFF